MRKMGKILMGAILPFLRKQEHTRPYSLIIHSHSLYHIGKREEKSVEVGG